MDNKEKQQKTVSAPSLPKCNERLAHMKSLGFSPGAIYDGGAFVGKWAKEAHELFPSARLILIEPNTELLINIEENVESFKNQVMIENIALTEKPGIVKLNVWKNSKHSNPVVALAASSLLSHVQGDPSNQVEVKSLDLDGLREKTGIKCDFLKLDLQGAEIGALKGGTRVLAEAELVVVEFGVLEAYEGRSTPRELLDIMYDAGFVLYDIVDVHYRPYDGGLVGGDFFFIKKDSKLKSHKDYF